MVIFVFLFLGNKYFPQSAIYSDEFKKESFLYRILYVYVTITLVRTLYEFVWYFVNSAMVFSGFAYNGRDAKGNILWNDANNINLFHVELAGSPRECVANWNITISDWLRHYK